MGNLVFNGISTVDLGLVIQAPPTYEFPEKDYEITHVDGKNGDIIVNKGSYKNVTRIYYLASVFRPGTNFIGNARQITEWLTSANGYARLEDSYEPYYYRLASFGESGEMSNLYDKATVLEVKFNCKPQRYLKDGDNKIKILDTDLEMTIVNPTDFASNPEIEFESDDQTNFIIKIINGETETSSNTNVITIDASCQSGIIDSEIKDCYNQDGYINNKISASNGFPILVPGINKIKIISGSGFINIKPKWWTL